jgi:hypothetical protein
MDPLSATASVVQILNIATSVVGGLSAFATEYNGFEDELEQLKSTIDILREEHTKFDSNIERAAVLGINFPGFEDKQRRACQKIQIVSDQVNEELEKLRQRRGSLKGKLAKAGSVLWNGAPLREMKNELNSFRNNLQSCRQGLLELSYSSRAWLQELTAFSREIVLYDVLRRHSICRNSTESPSFTRQPLSRSSTLWDPPLPNEDLDSDAAPDNLPIALRAHSVDDDSKISAIKNSISLVGTDTGSLEAIQRIQSVIDAEKDGKKVGMQ